HLVRRLAASGCLVRVAGRDPEKAMFLKTCGDVGQIVPKAADLTNAESVAAAIEGADWVVNLVGILSEHGRSTFETIHVEAVRQLAKLCRKEGVHRLVHVSALGASEIAPSVYGRSKAMGEKVLRDHFPDAVILRPSVVFGPEDRFFNMFAGLARVSPWLPVFTNDLLHGGGARMQPLYVGDLADAIMKALESDAVVGKTFELGGPRVYTMQEIMELTSATIRRKRWVLRIPFWIGRIKGRILQQLPHPFLTADQVSSLTVDNVVTGKLPGFKELGIEPDTVEAILPTYLDRYRILHRHTALRVV
ncbi:MAG: complex I NDUFA9 subunit family protein, partial [Alphaproteobacteria bacterium]|nr:complex I NDUFA9 subunit family protein [Alphaproteobacteria bacterium]